MIETASYYAACRNVEERSSSPPPKYKKNNNNNMYYQQYRFDVTAVGDDYGNDDDACRNEVYNFVSPNDIMTRLSKEDALILDKSVALQTLMRKSHSYCGTILPKTTTTTTIIKQDSLNGSESIETSLNAANCIGKPRAEPCRDYDAVVHLKGGSDDATNNSIVFMDDSMAAAAAAGTGGAATNTISNENDDGDQEETLLLPDITTSPAHRSSNPRRNYNKSPSLSSSASSRSSMCYRVHEYITRNWWYLNYLVPISILIALAIVAYMTRDYAKRLLFWIETQNPWLIFTIFTLLFIIVSFPVAVGYFVLMITSGYIFGFFKGLSTVILGANIGTALAHMTIRALRHRIPLHRFIKNETGRAILRVITGPRAFRVVIFTRLTPIPFGFQNAIFGVSSINPRTYYTASFIGLLPAQIVNVYLGSTLRSMHEVLNSHGTAVTGYISFGIEVICGLALMFWVVQKARKELSDTLLSCGTERKIIDIEV